MGKYLDRLFILDKEPERRDIISLGLFCRYVFEGWAGVRRVAR